MSTLFSEVCRCRGGDGYSSMNQGLHSFHPSGLPSPACCMVTSGLAPHGHKTVATAPNTTSSQEHIQHWKAEVSPHVTHTHAHAHTHTHPEREPLPGTTQQISQQFSLARMWFACTIITRGAGKTRIRYSRGGRGEFYHQENNVGKRLVGSNVCHCGTLSGLQHRPLE